MLVKHMQMDLMYTMIRGGKMQKDIISLFPIPLIITEFDCGREIKNFLEQEPMKDTVNNYGWFSKNSYLLNESRYKKIADIVKEESLDIMRDILGVKCTGTKIMQSWLSYKEPNQNHQSHVHSNSFLSGVYYFEEDDEPIEPIKFYKNVVGINAATIAIEFQKDIGDKPFAWEYFQYTPKPNTLIFFPSWLMHSVDVNNTNKRRKSLAFNVLPDKLGSEVMLNELIL